MAEVWLSTAVFSTSETPAIRPYILSAPVSSLIPAPLPAQSEAKGQPISGVTQSLCFLGHPFTAFRAGSTPSQHSAWPPSFVQRAVTGFPVPGVPSSVTLGRCFTPGLIVSERLSAMCLIDLETVPFWASLSSGFGWFVHDDASTHLQLSYP